MKDTQVLTQIVEYKGCDHLKISFNKITVVFRNIMTNHFWQKDYPAHLLSADQILRWKAGEAIQIAMPGLDSNDREHFLTGFTQKEIDSFFGED